MPQFPLGQYSYRRGNGIVPSVELQNVYFEHSPSQQRDGSVLLTRPTLTRFLALGTGRVRGIGWEDDVFDDDALVVIGSELYRVTEGGGSTLIGTIPGDGLIQFAFSRDECQMADSTGAALVTTDGSAVTTVTFPDNLQVCSVVFIDDYFLAVPVDTHKIYYTDPTTNLYGPLVTDRFISAQRYPDRLKRLIVKGDEIWAMGSASVEVFQLTGVDTDTSPPFSRVEGRLYRRGVVNADTVVEANNNIFWVGWSRDEGYQVYRGDSEPLPINDEHIAERLGNCDPTILKAWAFGSAKHSFYVVEAGSEGTMVFDLFTGGWFDWTSHNRDQWRAHVGRGCWPGKVLVGDDESGILYLIDPDGVDDDGAMFPQVFTGGVPLDSMATCSNVTLDCAVGQAAIGLEAKILLEFSDDQGRTWNEHDRLSLGESGAYDTLVRWWQLGQMGRPGRIFRWTVLDRVRMRVSSASMNDAP